MPGGSTLPAADPGPSILAGGVLRATLDEPGHRGGPSGRLSLRLGLVVSGLSNQQIADRLYRSINSVKTYIRSAYRKLGVSSRAQAVAWGVQHGFPVDEER